MFVIIFLHRKSQLFSRLELNFPLFYDCSLFKMQHGVQYISESSADQTTQPNISSLNICSVSIIKL